MKYARCKCGKSELWTTDGLPKDCHGCRECQTTYAFDPSGHRELQPHTFEQRYDERTGKPKGRMCSQCYSREGQVA